MLGISCSQTPVSISAFLMILMFIPDFKKKLFCWNQPFLVVVVAVKPAFNRLKVCQS